MRISDWSSDVCSSDLRLHGGLRRARLVVPFREVADQPALVDGAVDPFDPRPPLAGVERPGGAQDDDRRPVAPGIEDAHGRVHQADIAVNRGGERPIHDLAPALGDAARMLLVHAEADMRPLVAKEDHEAVVQMALARAGIEADIREILLPRSEEHTSEL